MYMIKALKNRWHFKIQAFMLSFNITALPIMPFDANTNALKKRDDSTLNLLVTSTLY